MRYVLLLLFASCSLGCVKRTISITTNPPGALVWINDREIGRTPVDFPFTYHGEYDVRIERDGSEPVMTSAWTDRPVWDASFVDFVAEIAPVNLHSKTVWHFELSPPNNDQELLLKRANTLRSYTSGVGRE